MKLNPLGVLSAFVFSFAGTVFAQSLPATPPRPFPGLLNEHLRADNPSLGSWDVGVNVRLREEDKEEAGTTQAGSNWDFSERPQDNNHNEYQLLRVMPRIGYTSTWFTAFAEGRSSYSYGDKRYNPTAPGVGLSERDGPIDLHQAYLLLGNQKQSPFSLKIGRQELAYGDQRLVGPSRWLNVPRTFDAIKVRYQSTNLAVDLFTGGVVYVDHNAINKSNTQDVFSGLYLNFLTLSPRNLVETYLLARNVNRGIVTDDWSGVAAPARFTAPQDLYTAGFRFKSKPTSYGPWDYTVEMMYQFGNRTAVFPATTVAAALAAKRLDQSAYAVIAQAGYTWSKQKGAPRLAVTYSFGSGDKDAADGKSSTFQNLFPSNHLLYGSMDLSSLQNLHDFRIAYTIKPIPAVTLSLEGHVQYLAQTTDFWYNVAGVPRNFTGAAAGSGAGYRVNPSYGHHLGNELDLLAGWTLTRYALLEVGVSHYFRGEYIKQSLRAVGSHDASAAYVQLTLNL